MARAPKINTGIASGRVNRESSAPLRFTPSFSLDQWRWCLAFLRECTQARSRQTTRELLALGFYSQTVLHELLDAEAIPFDHRESGKLIVYRDPVAFAAAQRLMRYQAELGCAMVVVEHDMAFVRELGVKVTCLHEGSVLAEGSIEQVSSNARVVEVYLGR